MKAIVAIDLDYNIGDGNKLFHHYPEDLKHFRAFTMGKTLVMGRRTYESLPSKLKGRNIIILTRDRNYLPLYKDNTCVLHSKKEVLELKEDLIIAGGVEIYKLFKKEIKELHLTRILKPSPRKGVRFPLDINKYKIAHQKELSKGVIYYYLTYL